MATIPPDYSFLEYGVNISNNGIAFIDPRPLIFCDTFSAIVRPVCDQCHRCQNGFEVTELEQAEREMFLGTDGNLSEEDPANKGKAEAIYKVTAKIIEATVKNKNKAVIEKRYVKTKAGFDTLGICPRNAKV